jgi:hypothetical protein
VKQLLQNFFQHSPLTSEIQEQEPFDEEEVPPSRLKPRQVRDEVTVAIITDYTKEISLCSTIL